MKPVKNPTQAMVVGAITIVELQLRKREPERKGTRKGEGATRIPRVTRLLALAHKIDGMIRSGELKDWAEAARLVGVTRARMTQIANLLLLAPAIQESLIGSSPGTDISGRNSERSLRAVLGNECLVPRPDVIQLRVEWTTPPGHHLAMFRMTRVGHSVQELVVPTDAANVLGWAGALGCKDDRILSPRDGLEDAHKNNDVLPTVAKVVLVHHGV